MKKIKKKLIETSEDLKDILREKIAENFGNSNFPKETQADIQMIGIRNEILFENIKRFLN